MTQSTAQAVSTEFATALKPDDVRLTPAAEKKMADIFADTKDDLTAIRIFVSGGGCGGMSYGMTFTDRRTDYDCVLQANGFDVYVDAVALTFMRGVEIDFVERSTGASFVFNNVFASTGGSGVCGACGAAGGGCA
ncbi:MAG: iron-sulfur cluster assembly accessory protein [Pseudomonadota bacterium]|nr:iron-sulfur cluster assembly accessory protein [Pseudomonadota bacterium]